jgi:hypothetical protein
MRDRHSVAFVYPDLVILDHDDGAGAGPGSLQLVDLVGSTCNARYQCPGAKQGRFVAILLGVLGLVLPHTRRDNRQINPRTTAILARIIRLL